MDSNGQIVESLASYGFTITEHERQGGTPSPTYVAGDSITADYVTVGQGLYITPQLAKFQSRLAALSTQYKENEHIRLTFVIEPSNNTKLIYMYINGIMSGVSRYSNNDVFDNESYITLGAIGDQTSKATLDIYTIRSYDFALSR